MNILNRLKSENHASLLKYMLVGAIGFGIGGAIWGFLLFKSIPSMGPGESPFTHLMDGIVLGAIGGVFLALPFKDIKKLLLSFLLGAVGFLFAFLIGSILSYPLYFIGHFFTWHSLFILRPYLLIGDLVFVFAVVGAIGGFFYSIALKKKIGPLILAGMLGFAIGSLIGPLVGNFTEMIFESLLGAYVITFLTIGLFTGISFGIGVYFAEKTSISK
ncbi:MAG: hypothetical protein AEth_01082 [Candidatus Argoarchaeum ethanivorans]|uniref:Uncharacterized protein n=1 Tax=Candidatus Argoarchaeum ethanivorans TaxID=2608793 RepID=A0A8B3S2M7_9EURY|nr:MAG: hypothetical protein AEth_01082 [Candidatus Argoarchaeum ethanivorans]